MGDTTPQDRAVRVLIERFRPKVAPYVGMKPDMDRGEQAVTDKGCILNLGEIVDCLADAGLLSSPQGEEVSSLRSERDLVDKVTAALSGYRHNLGPKTISLIRDGVWKSLPLSLGEMRDIAWLLQEAGLLYDHPPKASGEAAKEVPS